MARLPLPLLAAAVLCAAAAAPTAASYTPPRPAPAFRSSAFRSSSSSSWPAVALPSSLALSPLLSSTTPASPSSSSASLGPLRSRLTKAGMVLYIASMCVSLPLTLLPLKLAERLRLIGRLRREQLSLRVGCFCSRWMFRLFPFARLTAVPASASEGGDDPKGDPKPSVWVCNHTSMLDIFVMLAMDKRLRGTSQRPIKIVYWKGLEDNPVTKLLFTMCGMISVDMADNGNGNANEYDRSSFKSLLKNIKAAFEEGFDVGILPEGQLNPNPEGGLLPVFGGAFSLARMSRRPIRMMALHGVHRLWHPDEAVTMPTGRDVTVRTYPEGRPFGSGDEFVRVFTEVVGHFGAKGTDVPDLEGWLDGTKWDQEEQQVLSAEKHTEEKAEEEKK